METHRITIYHTNDIHDHISVFRMLTRVKEEENTLLLDAGDAIGGSSTVFRLSERVLDLMNQVRYDALTMGNRELNYIRWVLKIRARQAEFPILSANLEDLTGKADGAYQPYIIRECGGLKVGIFGLTPVQYDDDSKWLPLLQFRFLEPMETARKMVEELRDKVDLLIMLSHLGINPDREIASQVKGIDLIIGGHTHTLLEEPLKINGVYIFQAGSHGKMVGKIDLQVKKGNQPPVVNLEYRLLKNDL